MKLFWVIIKKKSKQWKKHINLLVLQHGNLWEELELYFAKGDLELTAFCDLEIGRESTQVQTVIVIMFLGK